MAYLVLARRWRPQRFEDVIGQRHVTQTLQNAILSNRVAHAFLFSGARGVGKTTVARILAKALNCEAGPTPHPCGQCDSCREITDGISLDVQEIDGASNTHVDDVRELMDGLRYRPAKGRYRIYIIDEVHMLSGHAFNALLKTLEEPPPHVVFIFATTEPQKIPLTVVSRCQRYDFKRIPLADIVGHLERISLAEGIRVDRDTLLAIAKEAQGSLRDAQSLLDQVISYAGENITREAVQEVLGLLDREWLFRTSEALIRRDPRGCLELVDGLFQHGYSLTYFYQQLVEHLRNLMLARLDQEVRDLLPLPDHEISQLRRQAQEVSPEDLHLWFDILVKSEEEIRRTAYPRYLLELLLVKMARLDRTQDIEAILEKIRSMREAPPGPSREGDRRDSPPFAPGPAPLSASDPGVSLRQWEGFLGHVRAHRPALAAILEQGRFIESSGQGRIRVAFSKAFHVERIREQELNGALEGLCQDFFRGPFKVVPVLEEQGTSSRDNHVRQRQHQMQVAAKVHPLVQEALEIFDGRIVEIRLPDQGNRHEWRKTC